MRSGRRAGPWREERDAQRHAKEDQDKGDTKGENYLLLLRQSYNNVKDTHSDEGSGLTTTTTTTSTTRHILSRGGGGQGGR